MPSYDRIEWMSGPGRFIASHGITRSIAVINAEKAACPKRQAAFVFPENKKTEITVEKRGKSDEKALF